MSFFYKKYFILQATREHIEQQRAYFGSKQKSFNTPDITWRTHHLIEYYSLGNVDRTGHLVDDPESNTYRALRFMVCFVSSKSHLICTCTG